MTEFKSESKTIPYNTEDVFNVLSDLNNLEQVKHKIPEDKVGSIEFDRDSCSFTVNPVGKIKFSIVDRQPDTTIKFKTDESPVEMFLWIFLTREEENSTTLELKVEADLNPMIRPMVSKPLQNGIEKLAEILSSIPYK